MHTYARTRTHARIPRRVLVQNRELISVNAKTNVKLTLFVFVHISYKLIFIFLKVPDEGMPRYRNPVQHGQLCIRFQVLFPAPCK